MVPETRLVLPATSTAKDSFWVHWRRKIQRSSLWRLLGYVPRHQRYARLTLLFCVAGFLLSFVYPSLIGAAVDLVNSGHGGALEAGHRRQLFGLAGLALLTALIQSVVVYGRGHFNVHLSDSIITDLRRDLFDHLQKLSIGFYTKERIGSILSRLLHDVHEATALIYTGIIVAVLDCIQLSLAIFLLSLLSWKLTMACLAVFPLYALIFVKIGRAHV